MKKFIAVIVLLAATLALNAIPAKADTVIVFNGTGSSCGGSDCFGNDLKLTIHPTGGNNYQVTMDIDTTGNTNVGSAIAGVTFKFGSMTAASPTSAPGGTAGWFVASPSALTLNANGCTGGGQSVACTDDTAFISTLNASSPTAGLASLPHNGTYEWQYDVTATGLSDPLDIVFRVLFGKMNQNDRAVIATTAPTGHGNSRTCPTGYTLHGNTCEMYGTRYSYKQTGIISAEGYGHTQVPEPATIVLLGAGLLGLAGLALRRS